MSSEILKTVIVDSSCLIVLAKIGSLELLRDLYQTIVVTPEIREEFGAELPAWVQVNDAPDVNFSIPFSLGRGESSAIKLSHYTSQPLLILDDFNARAFASKLGLDYIGTLGVLLEAKFLRIIPDIQPLVRKIMSTNFYLDSKLVQKVMNLAGEKL